MSIHLDNFIEHYKDVPLNELREIIAREVYTTLREAHGSEADFHYYIGLANDILERFTQIVEDRFTE